MLPVVAFPFEDFYIDTHHMTHKLDPMEQQVLFYTGLLAAALGIGGIRAILCPMGAYSLQSYNQHQLLSFFNWWVNWFSGARHWSGSRNKNHSSFKMYYSENFRQNVSFMSIAVCHCVQVLLVGEFELHCCVFGHCLHPAVCGPKSGLPHPFYLCAAGSHRHPHDAQQTHLQTQERYSCSHIHLHSC